MAILHSSVSYKGNLPRVYGLFGYPRLMSYDRNTITVYRVEGREEFANDQFHTVICQWIEDKDSSIPINSYIYGEHDKYGEIFARIRVPSIFRYNQLREYLNQRYVGIAYPGAGVLRVHDDIRAIPEPETIVGGYKYRYGTTGFILRDDSDLKIAQAYVADQSMEIYTDTYLSWDSKTYVDKNFTEGKGLLESASTRIETKLQLAIDGNVSIRMQDYEIFQMIKHIYRALRIYDASPGMKTSGHFDRYFTSYVP